MKYNRLFRMLNPARKPMTETIKQGMVMLERVTEAIRN